jgi:ribose 5-phosphate isomerase B
MKIFIGSDHAGFEIKEHLVPFLKSLDHEVEDLGAHTLEPLDDYPDYIKPVALAVAEHAGSEGIILGGTGQGEAMCANRVPGIRAAVYYGGPFDVVLLSREHNNANILSLGARFIDADEAEGVVKVWLETKFTGDERHVRRLRKLDEEK